MRKFLAVCAVAAMACGGGETGGETADMAAETGGAATEAAATEQPAPVGAVHEVEMLLTADGQYVYRPETLTIRVGDRVRWISVSGFPHNVAFYPDRIPSGASSVLQSAMPGPMMGELSGPLLVQPNATYEVTFSGAPTGTYEYYCTPHEMLGMTATLIVTE